MFNEKFIKWLKAAGIRALRTFAQTMLAHIGVSSALVSEVEWDNAVSIAVVAMILSILTSIAGLPEVE